MQQFDMVTFFNQIFWFFSMAFLVICPLASYYNSDISRLSEDRATRSLYLVIIALLLLLVRTLRAVLRYFQINKIFLTLGISIPIEIFVLSLASTIYFTYYKTIIIWVMNRAVLQNFFFYMLKVEDSLWSLAQKERLFILCFMSFNTTLVCLLYFKDILLWFYLLGLLRGYASLRDLVCDGIYEKKFSKHTSLELSEDCTKWDDFDGEVMFLSLSTAIGSPLKDKLYAHWKKSQFGFVVRRHMRQRITQALADTAAKVGSAAKTAGEKVKPVVDKTAELAAQKPEVVLPLGFGAVAGGGSMAAWYIEEQRKNREEERQRLLDEENRQRLREEADRIARLDAKNTAIQDAQEKRASDVHQSTLKTQSLEQELLQQRLKDKEKDNLIESLTRQLEDLGKKHEELSEKFENLSMSIEDKPKPKRWWAPSLLQSSFSHKIQELLKDFFF